MMAAIIVHVISQFFSVLHPTDTATDTGLAFIVFTQILRVGQHGLEKLQRNDFHPIVIHLVYACHTDILNHAQMRKVFLPESHPETGTLDGREVFHQRFEFFVEQQIRVARTDVRIRQVLMDFHGLRLHPLSVLVITPVLRDFADVDFRIEVCGKSLMMVPRIAVHDVQVMDFVEIMFGRVCRIHAGNARVETAP